MFYFRLARELGMTVSRLLNEVSSLEVAGWMAYLKVEDELKNTKDTTASENMLKARLTAAGIAAQYKGGRLTAEG